MPVSVKKDPILCSDGTICPIKPAYMTHRALTMVVLHTGHNV